MSEKKSRTERKKQTQKRKKPIWKKIITTLFIIFTLIILSGLAVITVWIIQAPKLDHEKLTLPYATQFYTKDGELFADVGSENRIKIEYDDLPESLINAVTATEDSRFFEHSGIDFRRLGGAIIANITRGFGSEGASTITHQVVEKMFLSPEKKIKLKVQEQWLAFQLEREFSKEQILEMYLNTIFYGSNAYGVAKAAEVYFDINDLHDLSLVQAAMLAGLPQRPSAYNPFQNPDLMQGRVDTVLTLMVRHGKITEAEAEEARKIDVASVLTEKKPKVLPHEAFIQQVENELEEKLENIDINSAGLKVYTTLDKSIQEHVEFLLTDSENNPINYPDEDLQAGLAVVDTETGEIRAIGGSRNRENVRGDNYAIKLNRQPGSTIKPIVAYGPAIEYEKWSTYHLINDEPYTPPGSKPIRNYNRGHRGWTTLRESLRDSLNVPAAKTLVEIGSDRAKPFAENLGIKFADEHLDPRDAIGGTKTTVTPLQLAGAYAAFGNNGIYTTPHSITKVEFPDGSVVNLTPESEAVMSDYTAYMITDVLKSVIQSGTGTNAQVSGLPIAGKTGTTNLEDREGSNNAWFSGYTTNYSIGVWAGYKENNRMIPDTQIPLYLFSNTMGKISENIETKDFVKPDSVVEVNIEKGSNPPQLPSNYTPNDQIITELFVKGTEPNARSQEYDELDAVNNLTANYDEANDAIEVSWDYEEEDNITFIVNYKIGNGSNKKLTTTTDKIVLLENIEKDETYTFEVIAINEETNLKSKPKSVSIQIDAEEIEIAPVENLKATFDEEAETIQVTWDYQEAADFKVSINGDEQTVTTKAIQIKGVSRGKTYEISVKAVIDGQDGPSKSTSITISEAVINENNNENTDNNDDENNNDQTNETPTNNDDGSNNNNSNNNAS